MNERDYIGIRGETIFQFLIGKRCDGRFWFHSEFLGGKAETKDFTVYCIEPSCTEATFFVQVKATLRGYSGKGVHRKLKARVNKQDVKKLKSITGPAYIAGIDAESEDGYLLAITDKTGDTLSGIPCTHKIDCDLIQKLWKEVERYWSKRNMLPKKSKFS